MRPLVGLLILAVSGCAAPAAKKVPFRDVIRAPERLKPIASKPAKPAERREDELTATSSFELQSALLAFSTRARRHRASDRGGAMPSEQIVNWDEAMSAVDLLLGRPPRETSSYDVVRARVALEAELELDARSYPQMPDELVTAVEMRLARLGYRMAQLRKLKVRTRVIQPDYAWPVSPVAVTSLFGQRLHPLTRTYRQHQGLDLAAAFGQEVYASAAGTVVRAEWLGAHGNHVEIHHPRGVVTRYSHLSEILVEEGAVVRQGQPIGLAGSTGASTGVHLHFELWREGRPRDPLEELGDPVTGQPVASW